MPTWTIALSENALRVSLNDDESPICFRGKNSMSMTTQLWCSEETGSNQHLLFRWLFQMSLWDLFFFTWVWDSVSEYGSYVFKNLDILCRRCYIIGGLFRSLCQSSVCLSVCRFCGQTVHARCLYFIQWTRNSRLKLFHKILEKMMDPFLKQIRKLLRCCKITLAFYSLKKIEIIFQKQRTTPVVTQKLKDVEFLREDRTY